jgi:hypothetical protein
LSDLTSDYASVNKLNANFDAIEAAFDNTISRDGSAPNAMGANLDMGSNRIINVGTPTAATDAATKGYLDVIQADVQSNATAAAASATAAHTSELNAATSASSAASSAQSAATSAALVIRGAWVSIIDYIPEPNRAAVLAGTYTNDASAWLQAALNSGKNVDLQGLTFYANNLTHSTNQRALFSSAGVANIIKNANGPILTSTGDDFLAKFVVFRGQAPYTGDNIVTTGNRPTFHWCGSMSAAGRALKAQSDKVYVIGTTYSWNTTDTTSAGYDIEVGKSGTATLYHRLEGVYTSQATGGIMLLDTGSHAITGGNQFGKLYIKNSLTPGGAVAGCNGGMTSQSRILGDITVEQSSAVFTANQFGSVGLTFTFAGGTSLSSVDDSNITTGVTFVNNGNANNYVARQVSAGGFPIMQYAVAAQPVQLSYESGVGLRCNWPFMARNGFGAYNVRNNANTADLAVIGLAQSSDSVFFGHGSGTGNIAYNAGTGGHTWSIAGTGFLTALAARVAPSTDNTTDLGSNTLRFKDSYGYTFNVANGFAGYKARNNANSADLTILSLAQGSDSVFLGHGSSTGSISYNAGSGGHSWAVTGTAFLTAIAARVAPSLDNATDFGTSALRFKDGYSYTWDAKTQYNVNGTKVLGARDTGWTAATGTALKTAYATYTAGTASGSYVQAELQSVMTALQSASQRIKALEDMCRTHGLIN